MPNMPKKVIHIIRNIFKRKPLSLTPAGQPENVVPLLSTDIASLPKISIVTPSFNQGHFLENCITSVINQNYPKLEYIIIDGGSTDHSVDVIKSYEEKVDFWVSEKDAGQSHAINKGFERSTGDVVAWLNADDFYFSGALTAVAQVYQKNLKASFYFGNGWRVDEAGQYKCDFFPDNYLRFTRSGLILGLNYILQPATFINRAHLIAVEYINPSLRYGMDTDLWIRLSELAPPEPVYAFLAASREYGATKTATGSFERIEELRQVAEKYSGLPMTPGILCYFLDTLHCLVRERKDVFPKPFSKQVKTFWSAAANLMASYGVRPDGFPIPDKSQAKTDE